MSKMTFSSCEESVSPKPISDTPRTDAEVGPNDLGSWPNAYVTVDFARTLERELSVAKKRIAELEDELREALREFRN